MFREETIGDLSTEMVDHLFMSVATNAQMTAHIVRADDGGGRGGVDGPEPLRLAAARGPPFHFPPVRKRQNCGKMDLRGKNEEGG